MGDIEKKLSKQNTNIEKSYLQDIDILKAKLVSLDVKFTKEHAERTYSDERISLDIATNNQNNT